MKNKIKLVCSKHPNYKGEEKPKNNCEKCLYIWKYLNFGVK